MASQNAADDGRIPDIRRFLVTKKNWNSPSCDGPFPFRTPPTRIIVVLQDYQATAWATRLVIHAMRAKNGGEACGLWKRVLGLASLRATEKTQRVWSMLIDFTGIPGYFLYMPAIFLECFNGTSWKKTCFRCSSTQMENAARNQRIRVRTYPSAPSTTGCGSKGAKNGNLSITAPMPPTPRKK